MDIPDELIELAHERRVIPFIGAGFSDALGLPSWESMLRGLCERVEGSLTYDELAKATGNDFLQIAEYLYLKADRRIGPLRRHIDRCMVATEDVVESGPHTELINLGAAQIYTTNYDDLIESAYRKAKIPVDAIVLPKDIALANSKRTQVVKYHGDLDHEETMVLTESNYYRRLDFDAPMDLKFRSDLLGKSVLFMGYSFRDVNIRLIWFKLMDMMRDVPERDRRASYIVRLNSNPALEDLYAAVGIKTIVLSPGGKVENSKDRAELLGSFLFNLSLRAQTAPVAATDTNGRGRIIASTSLIKRGASTPPLTDYQRNRSEEIGGFISVKAPRIERLLNAVVPEELRAAHADTVARAIPSLDLNTGQDLLSVARISAVSEELTTAFVRVLASQAGRPPREERRRLVAVGDHWNKVWSAKISDRFAVRLLQKADHEFVAQAAETADEDAAYHADILKRLANGSLTTNAKVSKAAEETLVFAAKLYPSVATYEPEMSGPPRLDAVLADISDRANDFKPVDPTEMHTLLARHLATTFLEERSSEEKRPRRPTKKRDSSVGGSGPSQG